MGANRMDPGVQGVLHTPVGFEAHGSGDVRRLHEADGVVDRQSAHGGHGLGAVDESQALLGHQLHSGNPGPFHGYVPGQDLSFILRLAQAQHGQHHVGQGGQVAAGAQGALLGNDRRNAPVQHGHQGLHQLQTGAGKALGQVVDPQEHDGVGDNQVSLELPALVLGDGHIAEFPKTGGNPIHHGSLVHQHIHHLAGLQNALLGLRGKGHRGVVPANCRQLLQGQCMACDQNFFHASASLLNCAFGRIQWGPARRSARRFPRPTRRENRYVIIVYDFPKKSIPFW